MSIFHFKHFSVLQVKSAMKVNTDALVLGALCPLDQAKNILDVGCGTGVISLMLAQRSATSRVVGLEVDADSFGEAKLNIDSSRWSERMFAIHEDYLLFDSDIKFDLIVSNPPYYATNKRANNERTNQAKHIGELTPERFFNKSSKLLQQKGAVVIIIPSVSSKNWIEAAENYDLYCTRKIRIYGKANDSEIRHLLVFSRDIQVQLVEEFTIRAQDGSYSDEYKLLTKEFHGVELE